MIGICGASGYIGWKLYNYLKNTNKEVWGTYCNHPKEGLIYFNLLLSHFTLFDKCNFVVITAAKKGITYCEENHELSFDINVKATNKFLCYLNTKKIPSLFISTDIVEDKKFRYCIHKSMVENFISINKLNSLIIRPGKINESNIENLCQSIYQIVQNY